MGLKILGFGAALGVECLECTGRKAPPAAPVAKEQCQTATLRHPQTLNSMPYPHGLQGLITNLLRFRESEVWAWSDSTVR